MASNESRTKRILSIQSHVVSGYCGNKSATFPMQLLGFEVDVINTVQLSCHTQYKLTRGQIYSGDDIDQIHEGLKENNLLLLYDHILSGYIADVTVARAVKRIVSDVKSSREITGLESVYTLDPVLGDDATGYYVPNGEEMAVAYNQELLPYADIITPNRFELSILSGIEIDGNSEKQMNRALEAIQALHDQGIRVVVLTSFEVMEDVSNMRCIVSYDPKAAKSSSKFLPELKEQWLVDIPKLNYPFTGTGDLFAALLSAWLQKTSFNFKLSFENTVNSIHEILQETFTWSKKFGDNSVQSHELRLVQNQRSILYPGSRIKAIRF